MARLLFRSPTIKRTRRRLPTAEQTRLANVRRAEIQKQELRNSKISELNKLMAIRPRRNHKSRLAYRRSTLKQINALRRELGASGTLRYSSKKGLYAYRRSITGVGSSTTTYTFVNPKYSPVTTYQGKRVTTQRIVPLKRYIDKVGVVRQEGRTGYNANDYALAQSRGVQSKGRYTLQGIRRTVPSEIKVTQGYELSNKVFTIGTALRILGKNTITANKVNLLRDSTGKVIGVEDGIKKQSYALSTPISFAKAKELFKEKQLGSEFKKIQVQQSKADEIALKKNVKAWDKIAKTYDEITARSNKSRAVRTKITNSINKVITSLSKVDPTRKYFGIKANTYINRFTSEILTTPYDFTVGLGRFIPEFFEKVAFQVAVLIQGDFRGVAVTEIKRSVAGSPLALAKSFDPRTPEGLANLVTTAVFVKIAGARKVGKVQAVKSIPKVSKFKIGTFLKTAKGKVSMVGRGGKVFKVPRVVKRVIAKVKTARTKLLKTKTVTKLKRAVRSDKRIASKGGKLLKKLEKKASQGKAFKKAEKLRRSTAVKEAKIRIKERLALEKWLKEQKKLQAVKDLAGAKARVKVYNRGTKLLKSLEKKASSGKLFRKGERARLDRTIKQIKTRLKERFDLNKWMKKNAKAKKVGELAGAKARLRLSKKGGKLRSAIERKANKGRAFNKAEKLRRSTAIKQAKMRIKERLVLEKWLKQQKKLKAVKDLAGAKARVKVYNRGTKLLKSLEKRASVGKLFRKGERARLNRTIKQIKARLKERFDLNKWMKKNAKNQKVKELAGAKARLRLSKKGGKLRSSIEKRASKGKAFNKGEKSRRSLAVKEAKARIKQRFELEKWIKKESKLQKAKDLAGAKARVKVYDKGNKLLKSLEKKANVGKLFKRGEKLRLKQTIRRASNRITAEFKRQRAEASLRKELIRLSTKNKKISLLEAEIKSKKVLLKNKKITPARKVVVKKRIQSASDILDKAKSERVRIKTTVGSGKSKSRGSQRQSTQQLLKTRKTTRRVIPKLKILNVVSVSTGIVMGSKISSSLSRSLAQLPGLDDKFTQGQANTYISKLKDIQKKAQDLENDVTVLTGQDTTIRQGQILQQKLKLVEDVIQKTKTKLTQATKKKKKPFKMPKLPNWGDALPKGKVLVVNPIVRIKGVNKMLKWNTTPNRARKRIESAVDNTTARSYSLKIVGVKKGTDIRTKKLKKFRPRVGKDKRVQTNVEKSKYAIDTKGEKSGLTLARVLKGKVRPKKAKRRKKPTRKPVKRKVKSKAKKRRTRRK